MEHLMITLVLHACDGASDDYVSTTGL
jgi:hypothetical protein